MAEVLRQLHLKTRPSRKALHGSNFPLHFGVASCKALCGAQSSEGARIQFVQSLYQQKKRDRSIHKPCAKSPGNVNLSESNRNHHACNSTDAFHGHYSVHIRQASSVLLSADRQSWTPHPFSCNYTPSYRLLYCANNRSDGSLRHRLCRMFVVIIGKIFKHRLQDSASA